MELHDLEKMTVVKLREEAARFEDIKGATGMSKDQLIAILCEKHGIPLKHGVRRGIGRRGLKEHIRVLKAERAEAVGKDDAGRALVQRRRLKVARRRLRKVIKEAKRLDAIEEAKAGGGSTEAPAS